MQTLGVITNNENQIFQRSIISGVREVAQGQGFEVLVDSIAEQQRRPIQLDIQALSGLIVIANVLSDEELVALYRRGKPITLVSHYVPELPIPAVISHNTRGMRQLTRYMIEVCGCQRFVYIRGERDQRDSIERERAFLDELVRHQCTAPLLLRGDFDPAVAKQSLSDALAQGAEFDGLIGADYLMALAAIETLQRFGLRVPQDVSVAGFGDGVLAEVNRLTTVAANVIEQGRRAARQLIGQVRGLTVRGLTVLNTDLILRDTCCIRTSHAP